jgi:2'-5' RNA ligase
VVRAFVAVDLGDEAKDAVCAIQRQLEEVVPRGSVRWTKPDQLHLTLWFLGNVPAPRLPELCQAVGGGLTGVARFRLRLGSLGAFPSPRAPRVLWVGLEGDLPRLLEVQGRVARAAGAFGDHQEARPFHAHLTIGRVNRPEAPVGRAWQAFVAKRPAPAPCEREIGAVRLIRSRLRPDGAEYLELASFALA